MHLPNASYFTSTCPACCAKKEKSVSGCHTVTPINGAHDRFRRTAGFLAVVRAAKLNRIPESGPDPQTTQNAHNKRFRHIICTPLYAKSGLSFLLLPQTQWAFRCLSKARKSLTVVNMNVYYSICRCPTQEGTTYILYIYISFAANQWQGRHVIIRLEIKSCELVYRHATNGGQQRKTNAYTPRIPFFIRR